LGWVLSVVVKRFSGKGSFWRATLLSTMAITVITWVIILLMARFIKGEWQVPSLFALRGYDKFTYIYNHYKFGTPITNFSGPVVVAIDIGFSLFVCFVLGAVSLFLVKCPWTGGDRSRRDLAAVMGLVTLLFIDLYSPRISDWKTPASIWEATLRTDPLSQRANLNLGVYWVKHKRPERAGWYYSRAASINPRNPTIWYDLALLYLRANDYIKAEDAFLKVVEFDPGNDSAHLNLGNIYLVTGREPEAIEEYNKVIEINPQNARAYYNIAALMEKKGDLKTAYDHCRKALELRSDFSKAAEMCGPGGRLNNPIP